MARRVITPEAILSYPHVFTPQAANEGEDAKYSAAFIFVEGTDLKPLKAAVIEAAKEKFGETKAVEMIRAGKLRLPFRDDGVEKGYPEGSIFVNARSGERPGIVSRIPDPKTGRPMAITDEAEIYAGCIVRASLTAFGYDRNGNKGVGFALNNIQKIRDVSDDERLDGRVAAENEFDADESAAADLSDLEDNLIGGGAATDDEEPEAPKASGKKAPAKKSDPLDDLL